MQQHSQRPDMYMYPTRPTHPRRISQKQRAQPTPLSAASSPFPLAPASPSFHPPDQRRARYARRAPVQLIILALLIEALFLALYPLLAQSPLRNDAISQALIELFPWLPALYWTTRFPQLVQLLARVPTFTLTPTGNGNANTQIVVIALAFVFLLIAARTGRRVLKERISHPMLRTLFCIVLFFTLLFSITFLCAPGGVSQDMFSYGLYARLVAVYHINPYIVPVAAMPHDILQRGMLKGAANPVMPGPFWIDLSLPIVLFSHDSIASVLLGFRLLGLCAHLINTILLWTILSKKKPQTRIALTLLYAWNPLVLLWSITDMHLDVVIVLFLLVAILFFQRQKPLFGWTFVLVAALSSLWCLLLIPLFFRLLVSEFRTLRPGKRAWNWLLVLFVTIMLIMLAYVPYWQDWGLPGLLANIKQTFLQDTALNSLDSALLRLPVGPPPSLSAISCLLIPHHWTLIACIVIGGILLFGFWLADTIELVVLFSSWILLALLMLLPAYGSWGIVLPLALALCSANGRTILLAFFLNVGAILAYFFLLFQPAWQSSALLTIALPFILWSWILFFRSMLDMTRVKDEAKAKVSARIQSRKGFSRPSWPSHSSHSRPSSPTRRW